jgi:hypothetical protein
MPSRTTRRRALTGLGAAVTLPVVAARTTQAPATEPATIEDSELAVFWPQMNIHERSALAFPHLDPDLARDVRHRYGAFLKRCRRAGLKITYLHPRASPTRDHQLVLVPADPADDRRR